MNISPTHNAPQPGLELQPQRTQASTTVESNVSPNQQQIEIAMRRLFDHCELPPEDLERLVQTRAARLHQKGETAQDVKDTFAKGETLNTGAKAVTGFLKSVPFGLAGATLQARPDVLMPGGHPISTVAQNVLTAAVYVTYNSIGITPFARSTQDTLFMSARDRDLDDAMKAYARSKDPSALRKGMEGAATVQTFTVKNTFASVLRYGVDKGKNTVTSPENAKRIADTAKGVVSSLGSPVAGAAMGLLQQVFDKSHQRIGPEFMMGRHDWEQQYDELKAYGLKDAALNVGSRALHVPLDIAQDLSKHIQAMFSPQGLVSDILILGGGIALTETFRNHVHTQLTESWGGPEAKLLADLSALPLEALYFGGWALTAAVTQETAAWADNMINKLRTRGALEDGDLQEGQALIEDPANQAVTTDQPSIHVSRLRDLEANSNAQQRTAPEPRTSLGGWNASNSMNNRGRTGAERPAASVPDAPQQTTGTPSGRDGGVSEHTAEEDRQGNSAS